MYQQIVHDLPTIVTHAAPMSEIKLLVLHIIPCEYLIPNRNPSKKKKKLA